MKLFIPFVLALCSPSLHGDWAKDLARDVSRETGKVRDKVKHEAQNLGADVRDHLVPPKFAPLSRDIPSEFAIADDTFWLGVIGDSSATGAVANPRFRVTTERTTQMIGDLVTGKEDQKLAARIADFADPEKFRITDPIEPLTRALYSRAEYDRLKAKRETARLTLQSKFSLAFDTEELAFPYLVGRAIGIPAPRIVLAAQDGKKVSAIPEQLIRLLEVPGARTLPPLVLASFVANDMCHPDNFERPLTHFRDNYRRDLEQSFDQLAEMPAAKFGTRVVFVAPLDVANILSNEELLGQTVEFENNQSATCRSIHDGSGVHGDFAKLLQTKLIGACRGILKPGADAAAQLKRVRDMQTEQFAALRELINNFNQRGLKIQVELATSVRDLEFRSGDAANDCFHLSARGHARAAERLLEREFKNLSLRTQSSPRDR